MQTYHPQEEWSYSEFLSESLQKSLKQIPSFSLNLKKVNFYAWVHAIHYSWLESLFKMLSSEEKVLLEKTLSKKTNGTKIHAKNNSLSSQRIQPYFVAFLAKKWDSFEGKDLNPLFLPLSSLSRLLNLNKSQLTKMIDLLGIHDLAAELRHILDRTLLEKIQQVLTSEQAQFLQYSRNLTIKWTPPKLNLNQWDGDSRTLHSLLHRRGLFRFACALRDEDPLFIWHICHRLDIGRGKAIEKNLQTKQDPGLTPYFKEQVLHLLNRFNPAS